MFKNTRDDDRRTEAGSAIPDHQYDYSHRRSATAGDHTTIQCCKYTVSALCLTRAAEYTGCESISQKCAHVVHFDYSKGGRAWSASWCESCCGRASPCRLRPSSCVSTSATRRSSSSSRTAATAQPTQASTTSCTSSHALHLCLTTPNRRNASRTAYPQRDHDHCTGINTSRRNGQLHRTRLW